MADLIVFEVDLFGISILLGMIIGCFYDIFEAMRESIKHKTVFIAIEDFVFWIVTTYIVFYTFYKFNYGQLRSYVFMGIFIGLVIYKYTLSKIVIMLMKFIFKIIVAVFKIFGRWIIIPLRNLCKNTSKALKNAKKTIRIAFRGQ